MIQAISLQEALRYFSLLTIFVLITISFIYPPMIGSGIDWDVFWRNIGRTTAMMALLVSSMPFAFSMGRKFFRKQFLSERFFPDLHGTWEGVYESNFPIKLAMMEGRLENPEDIPLHKGKLIFRINHDFWSVKIRMFAVNERLDKSPVTFLHATSARNGGNIDKQVIHLCYGEPSENEIGGKVRHQNSLDLYVDTLNEKTVLKGEYWTNRAWRSGLNTAGTIRLERISDDPQYHVGTDESTD